MAQIENPRKEFNFTLSVAPLPFNPWLAQEVDLPDSEIDVTAHGDTNHDINTAGRRKLGKITIKKLMTTDGPDNYFYDWHASCQDFISGGGLPPIAYKRVMTFSELAEDNATVINTWIAVGCWPNKISGNKLRRTGSDNIIEEIEITCDKIEKA